MVIDKIESLIDSLAFNANLNSISAILWQGARQEVNFPLNILPLKKKRFCRRSIIYSEHLELDF